ncbi:glycosyltransferase [Metabacillus sp. KUDC1714]|uniref:Glycosyltransferase n=2 Tax=Metabacillus elymi TaxID=2745198 RepID=A0ABX6SBQ8_9BACI|nr:glycosyltransferase [Metabacillus sp. KUDC1714]
MIINMNIGGTEKALLNMISEIPTDKYDITLLLLEKYGGFLNYIPSGVNVKYLTEYKNIKDLYNNAPNQNIKTYIRQNKFHKAIQLFFSYYLSKLLRNRSTFFNYILKDIQSDDINYDIAIAYAGPMDLISYFVLNKIKAKKKFQWVHFDVSKIAFNADYEYKMYKKFDKIFIVSQQAREKFIKLLPSLKDKTEVIQNIVSQRLIYKEMKSANGFLDNFKGIRILTIGRLTSEKGQDLAIKVLSRLIKNGYNIKWYCIGDGNSRKKYEQLINDYNLKNNFVLLGSDPNPYRYLDECDIYVQPSRHEGFCITLAEAKCLNKPIVTTNFSGAKEQIDHGRTGLIVDINENDIYNGVVKLIENTNLRIIFETNLKNDSKLSKRPLDRFYYYAK